MIFDLMEDIGWPEENWPDEPKGFKKSHPTGSRYICWPAPTNTDKDYVVFVNIEADEWLASNGFIQDGLPKFYTGNDNGNFRSWRKGDINIITTPSLAFYELFVTATELAKRLNIINKADRIALFQAVLYGVQSHNLHQRAA